MKFTSLLILSKLGYLNLEIYIHVTDQENMIRKATFNGHGRSALHKDTLRREIICCCDNMRTGWLFLFHTISFT